MLCYADDDMLNVDAAMLMLLFFVRFFDSAKIFVKFACPRCKGQCGHDHD